MKAVAIQNLTKEFTLGEASSLKAGLGALFNRLIRRRNEGRKRHCALSDLSLSIDRGEVVGVVGINGAGKSTLLKILSGVTSPTSGSCTVNGTVAPLIEVGAGLHGDLTGRENIYLNASILGVRKKVIATLVNDILEFAEIESYADSPVKRYSSGMKIRLGFAIATSIEADILIVDEVLSVGDTAFQRKCYARMRNLFKDGSKTVIIVSHDVRQLEKICTRMILLDRGKVAMDGRPKDVARFYYTLTNKKVQQQSEAMAKQTYAAFADTGDVRVNEISFNSGTQQKVTLITMFEPFEIVVDFDLVHDLGGLEVEVGIHTSDFVYICSASSGSENGRVAFAVGRNQARCRLSNMPIVPGAYCLRLCFKGTIGNTVWAAENLCPFRVVAEAGDTVGSLEHSLLYLPFTWDCRAQ